MMKDTFYEVTHKEGDGTRIVHSDKMSWHDVSVLMTVQKKDGSRKQVYASIPSISSMHIHHKGLDKTVDSPEGGSIFHSIIAETSFISEKEPKTEIIGVTIGSIKDGFIVEEYILNSKFNHTVGFKY